MAVSKASRIILRNTPLYFLTRSTISTPKSFTSTPKSFTSTPFSFISTPRNLTFLSSPSLLQPRPHSFLPQFTATNFTTSLFNRFKIQPVSVRSGGGSGGGVVSGGGGSGGNGGGGGGNSNWSLISWYLDLLAKFPVLTKAVTSALLTLVGDLVCQLVIDKAPTLDFKRSFIFTFLGLAFVGPTLHYWYLYLSKLITMPGASGALLRLVLDQFVFAPVFIGVFLSTLMTLEGRPSQVIPKLQQEWFSSVLANWQLWIPFQFLNFRFVPQQFQVLASNFVALVWNVILSFKAHKEVVEK